MRAKVVLTGVDGAIRSTDNLTHREDRDIALSTLVGASASMQRLRKMIERVAASERPVLVTGPTGAGKELVVRAIHALGPDPDAPLLDINCGAFPETLVESQLFGHERGAFTGADRRHDGFFAAAGKGTVFLDEVAELPMALQAKLLRVLESGAFRPVGSNTTNYFAGRVIAATYANLQERVEQRRFREDLFYRLNVLEVSVAPLDERREDIPLLLAHFASKEHRRLEFTEDALGLMQRMRWPGNVRELRNFVARLAVFAPCEPITEEIVHQFAPRASRPSATADLLGDLVRELLKSDASAKLEVIEQALIEQALSLSHGNKTAAARLLGVHRKVIERRTASRSTDDYVLSTPNNDPVDISNEAPASH